MLYILQKLVLVLEHLIHLSHALRKLHELRFVAVLLRQHRTCDWVGGGVFIVLDDQCASVVYLLLFILQLVQSANGPFHLNCISLLLNYPHF